MNRVIFCFPKSSTRAPALSIRARKPFRNGCGGHPGAVVYESKRVAEEWHRLRKSDIEPVLYLMEGAEKRNAYPTALSYLEKAERIDPVHSVVRAARLRLLAAGAMRHLQQKKPHLAARKTGGDGGSSAGASGKQAGVPCGAARSSCLKIPAIRQGPRTRISRRPDCWEEISPPDLSSSRSPPSRSASPPSPLLPVKVLGKAERSEIPAALAKMAIDLRRPRNTGIRAARRLHRRGGDAISPGVPVRSMSNSFVRSERSRWRWTVTKLAWAASTRGSEARWTARSSFHALAGPRDARKAWSALSRRWLPPQSNWAVFMAMRTWSARRSKSCAIRSEATRFP